MNLEYHEYANLFPMLGTAELNELAESIKRNGQRHAIVLFEEKILDGRNRYEACLIAGVEPEFREFSGHDPLEFVIDENYHRRQLTESQRAMVAAEMANLGVGGDRKSEDFKTPIGALISVGQAAEKMKVSPRSVDRAKRVLASGIGEAA